MYDLVKWSPGGGGGEKVWQKETLAWRRLRGPMLSQLLGALPRLRQVPELGPAEVCSAVTLVITTL